jgi:signal transduction histidine kinase/CheY-like chemotaxis protein
MNNYKNSVFKTTVILIVAMHLILLLIFALVYYKFLLFEKGIYDLDSQILANEHDLQSLVITVNNTFFVAVTILILSAVLAISYAKNQLFKPLNYIISALENDSKKCIKMLQSNSGEYNYVGNLLQTKSNQNFELNVAKIKAEENDRLKATFLENLSHEIRTPMNAIIGFTDLMLQTKLSENEKVEYLAIISKSGKNLVSIIEDLIEMSKIDAKLIEPNYSDIDLNQCLVEIYNTMKVAIPKTKQIKFDIIESNAQLFYNVKVDEVKLKQILINLLYNAIKFTDKGSVLFGYNIIEDVDLEFIEFKIMDTGIGISAADQKLIFDRFKRVESDLTIEKGGLGLGLSISKAYVEMMGGTIQLTSIENEGTIFTVQIPLKYDKTAKNLTQSTPEKSQNNDARRKTILIAEDDTINFLLIKRMLQVTNHEIIRAENGQIAVDIVMENQGIDLILMDIKMPVMNGYEAFEKINLIRPNLPIIAQTAHASEEDKNKILLMGFTDYITKPIKKELLIEMVNKQG